MSNITRKIIGVDLDDVLLNFYESFYLYHNEMYNTNIKREHITSFYVENIVGCTQEEMMQRIGDFYLSDIHKNTSPIEGAVEAITELSKDHKLIIITAKPDTMKEITTEWLDKHFPNLFTDIHFSHPHFHEKKRSKAEICLELGIEVFIDDAIHNAKNISEAGIPVFLLDSPWNQEEVAAPITRVHSWQEIVDTLNK